MSKTLFKIKVRLPIGPYLEQKDDLGLSLSTDLQGGLQIEHIEVDTEQAKVFATPPQSELKSFRAYAADRLNQLFAPVRKAGGFTNMLVLAIVTALLPFLSVWLVRGWRLEVVKRLAQEDKQPVASVSGFWRYLGSGVVLFFVRGLYFLPEVLILYVFGESLFTALMDVLYWLKDYFLLRDNEPFFKFIAVKVLPEVTIGILIHLVVALVYTLVIWPIYRITMIKYALGKISGWGFFQYSVFIDSLRIFRQNASLVLGIYFFTLSIDFLLMLSTFLIFPILTAVTLGIGSWLLLPGFHLFFRHWPKAYSYGVLGKKLLERNGFDTKQAISPSLISSSTDFV